MQTIMRSLKGLTVDKITCPKRGVYHGYTGDKLVMTVRQPRRKDTRNHKKAWNMLSPTTLKLYKRQYGEPQYYDSKYRCTVPYYDGIPPDFVPFIMEVDGKIVGFADQMYQYGDHYQNHEIPHDDVGASNNLCIIDRYHGLGIGTYFSFMSTYIAKHLGADWILGFTKTVDGMMGIRMKQGWETVKRFPEKGYNVIRKDLREET